MNFVPISKKLDEFSVKQDVENFPRHVQLIIKAFFHDKEDACNTLGKDIFETLQTRKSKWTPPEGQFASLHFFINKCRHNISKLNLNRNTKFSNFSSEERVALNFPRHVQLIIKAFFHDKEDASNTLGKDIFETLQTRKSKWTPPEGQFASLDFFINKCRHNISKLNLNRNTKFSNFSSEERVALENLSKHWDIIVKAADKGGALVVWRANLYQKEALRQLSDTSFYA